MEEPELPPSNRSSSSSEMEEGEIEDDLPTTTMKRAEKEGSPDSDIIIVEMDQEEKHQMPILPPQQPSHRLPSQPPFLPFQHHHQHHPPPPPPPPPFFPHQQFSHPSPQFYPQLPPAPPLPPPEPVPVREIVAASTQVINQLLSFGVSPEYLVSYGISKELVAIAFNELHYLLPTQFAHLAPPPGEGWKTPQEVFARPEKRPRSQEREETKAVEIDLKEMEVRKRQELMARKAAIASRNSMKATALQNELDSLFAQKTSGGPSPAALEAHPEDQDGIGHLRHAVTHTEQTVNTPPSGPFPSSRISSPSYQHRPYHGNGRANRPSAADFLGEEQTLVIELSDEESSGEEEEQVVEPPSKKARLSPRATTSFLVESPDSSDEDEDEDAIVTASLLPPRPIRRTSSNTSTRAPPSRTSSIPTPSTSSSKTLAQQQLELKEMEIKLVLEKIKTMEEKKKSKNGTSSAMEGNESNESASGKVLEVVEAKEKVEELKKDREELLAFTAVEKDPEMAVDEMSFVRTVEGADEQIQAVELAAKVSEPEPSTSSISTLPLDATPSKPSLLNRLFQAARSRSSSPSAPAHNPSLTHLAFTQATPANYRSYIVKKKGLDTNKRLCKFEMDGEGKCVDGSCKSLHFRDFEGEQQDLTDFLILTIKLPPTSTSINVSSQDEEKEKILKRGLELVLNVKNVGVEGRTFAQAREVAVEFVEGMLRPRATSSSASKA